MNLCFDRDGWYGNDNDRIDGWTSACKALVPPEDHKAPNSASASVLDVALVLAGDEEYLQHYSRHGLDLMLARLLFQDPQCIQGDDVAHRAKLCTAKSAED